MASDKSYLAFVLEQLSDLPGVTYRPMMGEFMLYYRGKIFGGIFDNRLLLKVVPYSEKFFSDPVFEIPYPGAKPMLLCENVDDRDALVTLICGMEPELPTSKSRK